MNNCCENAYQDGGTINQPQILDPEIIGGVLKGVTLNGGVTLDDTTASLLANRLCPILHDCILEAVEGATLTGMTLTNTQLKGAVMMDEAAINSVITNICTGMKDCIITAVQDNPLKGLEVEDLKVLGLSVTGPVSLDLDAANAIGDALAQKITDVVNDALTSGKLCCLHIEGAEINNSHGTNNTWTNTTLNGDTTINGNLTLDAEAIGNLCSALQPCIDARFEELLNTRGRVVTDRETILGNGTDDDPLRANLETDFDERLLPAVTTQTELPTTIVGGRDQLLGKPDYYVRIGKHIIPAWKG
jgi:hypothetical protein